MNNNLFMSKLRDLQRQSNGTSQYIAEWLMNNLDNISDLSLEQFGKKTNCSKPTIIRFCNQLGISGYNELKFRLEQIKTEVKLINSEFVVNKSTLENEPLSQYIQIKEKSSRLTYENYTSSLDKDIFVQKISNAKNIYIFCMNLSYNVSKNFFQRIKWMNKQIILENDLNSIDSYLNNISDEDVVIVISLSGSSNHIDNIIKNCNKQIKILGILGEGGFLSSKVDYQLIIPQIEHLFWDSYTIRAQSLIQILDFLLIDLIKT